MRHAWIRSSGSALCCALALAACGGNERATETPAENPEEPAETPARPPSNEWDLTIEVQFLVDESLSTQLVLSAGELRDFRYERRGDVGDGTEEVISCTGTLPDAEHEALAAALDLSSWFDDREPFTITMPGGAGPEGVWWAQRDRFEGHTPIAHVPPSEEALRAMVPTFERVFRAIREADGSWSTCTTRMDPG